MMDQVASASANKTRQRRQHKYDFFVESGATGLINAIFVLFPGWIFTKVANFVMNRFILGNDQPVVDLFYFPMWLIAGAIIFSLLIVLLAGLYPAARTAKTHPIKTLRHE